MHAESQDHLVGVAGSKSIMVPSQPQGPRVLTQKRRPIRLRLLARGWLFSSRVLLQSTSHRVGKNSRVEAIISDVTALGGDWCSSGGHSRQTSTYRVARAQGDRQGRAVGPYHRGGVGNRVGSGDTGKPGFGERRARRDHPALSEDGCGRPSQ